MEQKKSSESWNQDKVDALIIIFGKKIVTKWVRRHFKLDPNLKEVIISLIGKSKFKEFKEPSPMIPRRRGEWI